jgi:hypothetical protein
MRCLHCSLEPMHCWNGEPVAIAVCPVGTMPNLMKRFLLSIQLSSMTGQMRSRQRISQPAQKSLGKFMKAYSKRYKQLLGLDGCFSNKVFLDGAATGDVLFSVLALRAMCRCSGRDISSKLVLGMPAAAS